MELLLKDEKLKFKMTNRSYAKIDDNYGNAGSVINSVWFGLKVYEDEALKPESFGLDGCTNNALKILSATCITRELTVEELMEKLTPEQMVREVVLLASDIYIDYMGFKKADPEDSKKK
ncbi:hypothetical protein [Clostridium sp. B9]|uniref:hypothetical protein n=1 Tax=Clostridium sp. B9 TaxID=3423224 RepID=UPI003D2F0719